MIHVTLVFSSLYVQFPCSGAGRGPGAGVGGTGAGVGGTGVGVGGAGVVFSVVVVGGGVVVVVVVGFGDGDGASVVGSGSCVVGTSVVFFSTSSEAGTTGLTRADGNGDFCRSIMTGFGGGSTTSL